MTISALSIFLTVYVVAGKNKIWSSTTVKVLLGLLVSLGTKVSLPPLTK
jgi:hypothetical protein